MNVLASLAVLGILILIHEAGHFLAATSQGIRVNGFSIGFGPAIVKKQIKLIRLKGEKFLSSLTIQFTDGKHILISFNGVTPIDKLPIAHCELLTKHECS